MRRFIQKVQCIFFNYKKNFEQIGKKSKKEYLVLPWTPQRTEYNVQLFATIWFGDQEWKLITDLYINYGINFTACIIEIRIICITSIYVNI